MPNCTGKLTLQFIEVLREEGRVAVRQSQTQRESQNDDKLALTEELLTSKSPQHQ